MSVLSVSLPSDSPGLATLFFCLLLYLFFCHVVLATGYLVPMLKFVCDSVESRSSHAVGAVLLALTTTLPELIMLIALVVKSERSMALSVALGGGLTAFGLVPAVVYLVAPVGTLLYLPNIVRDTVFFFLSLGLLANFAIDGDVDEWEAVVMIILFCIYTSVVLVSGADDDGMVHHSHIADDGTSTAAVAAGAGSTVGATADRSGTTTSAAAAAASAERRRGEENGKRRSRGSANSGHGLNGGARGPVEAAAEAREDGVRAIGITDDEQGAGHVDEYTPILSGGDAPQMPGMPAAQAALAGAIVFNDQVGNLDTTGEAARRAQVANLLPASVGLMREDFYILFPKWFATAWNFVMAPMYWLVRISLPWDPLGWRVGRDDRHPPTSRIVFAVLMCVVWYIALTMGIIYSAVAFSTTSGLQRTTVAAAILGVGSQLPDLVTATAFAMYAMADIGIAGALSGAVMGTSFNVGLSFLIGRMIDRSRIAAYRVSQISRLILCVLAMCLVYLIVAMPWSKWFKGLSSNYRTETSIWGGLIIMCFFLADYWIFAVLNETIDVQ